MKIQKLIKGPSGGKVRIALATCVLSADGNPPILAFTVNEGSDDDPKPVEREFTIIGFKNYGGAEGPLALLVPSDGPGAPEGPPVVLIFYPEAPEGHVGHVEIDEGQG